jgi:glycosyltransferase involved in cell wall biosynthesis
MEAMARGRPVITTAVAGIPELVRHGQDGWLLTAGSVEAVREAMAACLNTPAADLARMGEAAAQRVRTRHDADHEATRLATLFQECGASSASSATPLTQGGREWC